MPVDTRAYSPIIEAMIATAANNRRIEQGQRDSEKMKIEEKQQAEQLKQHQQQIDQAHEMQLKQHELALSHLGLQKQIADMEANKNRLAQIEALQKIGRGGGDPNAIMQQLPGLFTGMQQPPSSLGIDFSKQGGGPRPDSTQFGTGHPDYVPPQTAPQAQTTPPLNGAFIYNAATEAENIKREALAKSSGEAEGKLPAELSMQQAKNAFEEKMTKMHIASVENIAKLSRDTQLAIANMTNATHLKVADMQYNVAPDVAKNMIIAAGTGQTKLEANNPIERRLLSTMQEMGWRNPDPKEINAARDAQQLLPVFDRLEKFIDKYLPSTSIGGFVQGHAVGLANKIGFPTDTQNELDKIYSDALNIGRRLEGLTGGRVLQKQMEVDLKSIGNAGLNKDQAKNLLNGLKEKYINQQENMIFSGMPDSQKELIYKTQGIKPGWLATAPRVNAKGHKLDEEMSMKMGRPVYAGQ